MANPATDNAANKVNIIDHLMVTVIRLIEELEKEMAQQATLDKLYDLIAPVNRKAIEVTPTSTFAHDLELDSLTVMDLVAEIEDEFDILLPINMLPELETVENVADAVDKIVAGNA